MRYYFYNHDTPVRLSFDKRTIILKKNTQYGLDVVEGRTVVVLDGFRYPVAEKYVSLLKKRSLGTKLEKSHQAQKNFFESFGHTALNYVVLRASKHGKISASGFDDGVAYALIEEQFGEYPAKIVFRITVSSVGASIYCENKIRFDVRLRTALQESVDAICTRMSKKFAITTSEPKTYTAQFSNIQLPDKSRFSGFVWTHAANWTLL